MAAEWYCPTCEEGKDAADFYYRNPQDAESWTCRLCESDAGPDGVVMLMEDALAQGLYTPDPADQFDSRGKPRGGIINNAAAQLKAVRNSGAIEIMVTNKSDGPEIGRSAVIGEAILREINARRGFPGVPGPHKVEAQARPAGTAEMDDDAKRKAEAERIAKAMGW